MDMIHRCVRTQLHTRQNHLWDNTGEIKQQPDTHTHTNTFINTPKKKKRSRSLVAELYNV